MQLFNRIFRGWLSREACCLKEEAVIASTSCGLNHRIVLVLLCVLVAIGIDPAVAVATDAVPFKKSLVKLIDTGLDNMEPYPGPSKAAIWVDDHRLVAGIPLERSAHDPKHIGRTVLYNLDSGKTQELMRYAHPLCWDAKTGNGIVVYYPNPDDTRNQEVLSVRIDQSGAVVERKERVSAGWWGPSCDVTNERDLSRYDRRIGLLRLEHGYIDRGQQGKGGNEAAVLVRPDGKKLELPLKGRQADGIRYLDFLGQYQLDSGGGCIRQGEKCPPDIHVMDENGKVTVITIPREIMDIMPIQRVHVVKNGLLFRAESREKREGYLLLRDGVLYELWRPGSPGLFSPQRLQRTETWGDQTISPDGCKVAFARGARPSRVFVFDHCLINK